VFELSAAWVIGTLQSSLNSKKAVWHWLFRLKSKCRCFFCFQFLYLTDLFLILTRRFVWSSEGQFRMYLHYVVLFQKMESVWNFGYNKSDIFAVCFLGVFYSSTAQVSTSTRMMADSSAVHVSREWEQTCSTGRRLLSVTTHWRYVTKPMRKVLLHCSCLQLLLLLWPYSVARWCSG